MGNQIRYVRRVKGGRFQGRVWMNHQEGHLNLGCYDTVKEGWDAVRAYLNRGELPLDWLPKYVRRRNVLCTQTDRLIGIELYGRVCIAGRRFRGSVVSTLTETPAEAFAKLSPAEETALIRRVAQQAQDALLQAIAADLGPDWRERRRGQSMRAAKRAAVLRQRVGQVLARLPDADAVRIRAELLAHLPRYRCPVEELAPLVEGMRRRIRARAGHCLAVRKHKDRSRARMILAVATDLDQSVETVIELVAVRFGKRWRRPSVQRILGRLRAGCWPDITRQHPSPIVRDPETTSDPPTVTQPIDVAPTTEVLADILPEVARSEIVIATTLEGRPERPRTEFPWERRARLDRERADLDRLPAIVLALPAVGPDVEALREEIYEVEGIRLQRDTVDRLVERLNGEVTQIIERGRAVAADGAFARRRSLSCALRLRPRVGRERGPRG